MTEAPAAAAPAPAASPDATVRLVVAKGRTVYLPRSTHPFRAGDVIAGKRRDLWHLVEAGHATPEP